MSDRHNPYSLEALKEKGIRDAESLIDKTNAKIKTVEGELKQLQEEKEGQVAYLHFLKTGKSEIPKKEEYADPRGVAKPPARKQPSRPEVIVTHDDYMTAIESYDFDTEFTAKDIADLTGGSAAGASSKLRRFVLDKQHIRVTRESKMGAGGRTPVYYRRLRPPVPGGGQAR